MTRMLNETQWQAEMKAALSGDDARDASSQARQLVQLAARCRRAERRGSITSWHREQALSAAAELLAEAGRHEESASILRRLVRHYLASLEYYRRAAASALGTLGIELLAMGSLNASARIARKASSHPAGLLADEPLLRTLMTQLDRRGLLPDMGAVRSPPRRRRRSKK